MSFWPFSQRRKSTQRYTKVIKSPTVEGQNEFQRRRATEGLPQFQSALLLREIRRPYDYTCNHPIPRLQKEHEVLVRVLAVGLNPIDWKAPLVLL
jgi:N-formylglutamate amidohydrolase